ncbi:hypothetical protein ACIQJ4_25455 [Streptomyces filamentosus]|uniref:hypothetical protein n=1 Tax=Streptomyces filamentosus TaxID=67294 RepID=UPI003821F94E
MTSPAAFRDQSNWADGYYEPAKEVAPSDGASTLAGTLPQTRDIGYLLPQGDVLHYGAANT